MLPGRDGLEVSMSSLSEVHCCFIFFLSGITAGQHYDQPGGASNYLCLPMDPIWGIYNDAATGQAQIYGGEFEVPNNFIFGSHVVYDHNPPCAVCRVTSRTTQFMLPGRNQCYPGWHREYHGYLVTAHFNHKGRTEYVCMDADPETDSAGYRNEDGALFYSVEGICGSLPCPPYIQHRELTCAVCSK